MYERVRQSLRLIASLGVVSVLAACSGDMSSPVAPSPSGSGGVPFGATIRGEVNRIDPARASTSLRAATSEGGGIVVRIAGTDLTTEVGPDGWFTFIGVPAR